MRIGPKMAIAVAIVERHQGCCKKFVAEKIAPNGSLMYGYRPVNRCIAAGLIRAERLPSGTYRLTTGAR